MPAIRLLLIALWTIIFYPFVRIQHQLKNIAARDALIGRYHAGLLHICGVNVTVHSKASDVRPLLLVCNHLSYMDIPVLLSRFPARFTPKIEIASWPVLGHFSRLCGSIFVGRDPDKIQEEKKLISETLASGQVVCLYPEATTGSGVEVLPFKSSFFSLAEETIEGRTLTVQPVAIVYRAIRRLPIDRVQWPSIAWYGDMELFPHLWSFLKLGSVDVELFFLEPVTLERFHNRKEMAAYCHKAIASQIELCRHEKIAVRRYVLPELFRATSKSK